MAMRFGKAINVNQYNNVMLFYLIFINEYLKDALWISGKNGNEIRVGNKCEFILFDVIVSNIYLWIFKR